MTVSPAQLAALLVSPSGTCDLAVVDAARRHGVAPLLYAAVRAARAPFRADPDALTALARIARADALVEEVQRDDARAVINALAEAGVPTIIFKGAALAYTAYVEPWQRPRADTDLLVGRAQAEAAAAGLQRLGYRRVARPAGEYVTHQFTYTATRGGIDAVYDVHWKIADPQVFADVLTVEDLRDRAVALPAFGDSARRVDDVAALIIACVHRVAHHYGDDLLIRICDIDRLARRLTPVDWLRFTDIGTRRRIGAVCCRGLSLAVELFDTPIPDPVIASLAVGSDEPSARYLRPGLRKIDILRSDLEALPTWGARARLLREHLFPRADYMTSSRPGENKSLRMLYLRRFVHGARRWFQPLG